MQQSELKELRELVQQQKDEIAALESDDQIVSSASEKELLAQIAKLQDEVKTQRSVNLKITTKLLTLEKDFKAESLAR